MKEAAGHWPVKNREVLELFQGASVRREKIAQAANRSGKVGVGSSQPPTGNKQGFSAPDTIKSTMLSIVINK